MNKSVVVVTGGNGQLAQYFIKFLQEQKKYHIIVSLRNKESLNNKFIFDKNLVSFEIINLTESCELIKKYKPEYFFNFAGFTQPSLSFKEERLCKDLNIFSVEKQLQYIYNFSKNTRYINTGSSEQYYGNNPYAKSKQESSRIVSLYRKEFNLFAIQPVFFNFTSPLQSSDFVIPKLIKEGLRVKKEIISTGEIINKIKVGNLDAVRWFCYIDDVIDGIWLAANQENYLLKNFLIDGVFQGEKVVIGDLINIIFNELGVTGDFIITDNNLKRQEENYYQEFDKSFGWQPKVDLKNIIRKMINFHSEKIF